ncbi:DUF2135 domain-containing protein [Allomuricauda sp. d1]|uniref:carboxypeptidase-like regulatory domain-containing protein n=1 Tax=Allomuricauda sp. d1 TaxID=3136725 RepID=UPI0031D55341
MKTIVTTLVLSFALLVSAQTESKTIFGIVTDGNEAIVDAEILNKNSGQIALTDLEGKYEIKANIGDILQYSYAGMNTRQVIVEDVTRILNMVLKSKVTMLKEVTVTERFRPQEKLENNYHDNPRIIKTVFGYLNTRVNFGQVVDLDNINTTYGCLVDLLRTRLQFLTIRGGCGAFEPEIFTRGIGSFNPQGVLFDVDGQLMSIIPEIPIFDIKRVALLRDFATRVKYGSLGAGGIIVINTYGGAPRRRTVSEKLGLSDVYEKRSSLKEINTLASVPNYIRVLEKSESIEKAKGAYTELNGRYTSSPYFFLDAYEFFFDNGETDFSDSIIEEDGYNSLFSKNPVLLKALAYIYQEQGRYEKANEALKEVFILRPNYAQSYFDLANSYRDLGDTKFAAELYSRYNYLIQEGFLQPDTVSFGNLIKKEAANLVALDKKVISKDIEVKKSLKNVASNTTRLVFEWNDSEAEFDLELLQGKNEYYVYNHTEEESPEDIARGKEYGYSVAEYVIDERAARKPWQINLNYHGNKSLTPTYLKVTMYRNYGTPSQSKQVQVFKLMFKGANQKLLTL